MSVLIIGGTSGLGLELAKKFRDAGNEVIVTGRRELDEPGISRQEFELAGDNLPLRVREFVAGIANVSTLVYAAGYFQEGRITDLSVEQIEEMIDVGGRGLIYFVRELLDKQAGLEELITITSTSGWTPRQKEPVYNFVKAGSGNLSNGLAEDGRIGKVLVAGPAGMATNFWENNPRDMSAMLDPAWVAGQIMDLRGAEGEYVYRFAKIMREPARVEIVETR
jgi:short-subunit dehydrogenase